MRLVHGRRWVHTDLAGFGGWQAIVSRAADIRLALHTAQSASRGCVQPVATQEAILSLLPDTGLEVGTR